MMGTQRQSNDAPATRALHTAVNRRRPLSYNELDDPISDALSGYNPMIVQISDKTTTSGKVPSGD